MTESQVKQMLQEFAAEAPPFRDVSTATLRNRIRRRRRRRELTVGATMLSVVAVVTGAAMFGVQWIENSGSDGSQHRFVFGRCGERIIDAGELAGPLRMTADFPARVTLPANGVLEGTVTFTNVGSRELRGIRGRYPDTYLAKDGVAVTGPLEIRAVGIVMNLRPGESDTLTAYASLQKCPRGPSTPWPERVADLEPGDYEMYAAEKYFPDGHTGPEDFVAVHGGPWKLEIR